MLTGRRAFDGEDMAEVLGAVVRLEPSWEALPADVPLPVRTLLQSCLVKDRGRRVADISTALFVLDKAASLAAPAAAVAAELLPPPSLWRRATGGAALVTMGALLSGAGVWSLTRHEPPAVVRTTVTTSDSAALEQQGGDRDVAITPVGSRIVYRGSNQLLVRALNQLEPQVLSGLGSPRGVFISPDGEGVGFFNGAALKHVAITGGPPVLVTTVDGPPRGATWGPDGTLVFATDAQATGLQRVALAGGEVTVLTRADPERGEGDHRWPEFLPGGEALLFTITPPGSGDLDNAQIAVFDLASRTYTVLVRGGSHAHYVPSGHLVYGGGGRLWAVAFDLRRLEVVGTPAPVLDGVATTFLGAANVAVAGNGSLVYVPGGADAGGRQTALWVDRQGRSSPLPGLPVDSYRDVRVSPDGARVAFATATDVWTYDIARATLSRLTTDGASDRSPLWTPDGQRIVFTSNRSGYPELFWRPADGSGMDLPLLTRATDLRDLRGTGWSKDGTQLLFTEVTQGPGAVGQFAVERPSDVQMLLKSSFSHDRAVVSPHGAWMAYQSNVSGRSEIYVEHYPDLGGRQQVSSSGGVLPLWSRTGGDLFFTSSGSRELMAVAVQSSPLVMGPPHVLFGLEFPPRGGNHPYDIAPDGRFVILRPAQEGSSRGRSTNLIVVQNWFEELKRLVPVN